MRKSIPLKIAAVGAGLVMIGGVAAAAVTTPDEASDGLDTASDNAGFEVPTSGDVQPVKNQNEVEDDTVEDEAQVEETTEELEGEGVGPVDSHGAAVTEHIESTDLTGKEFGQSVAEVAKSSEGKPDVSGGPEDSATESDDGDDEGADSDASVDGADHAQQGAARSAGKRP